MMNNICESICKLINTLQWTHSRFNATSYFKIIMKKEKTSTIYTFLINNYELITNISYTLDSLPIQGLIYFHCACHDYV